MLAGMGAIDKAEPPSDIRTFIGATFKWQIIVEEVLQPLPRLRLWREARRVKQA